MTKNTFQKLTICATILIAFALRLAYALHSNPFIDEFTTVLASKAILQHGWPVLPSGLFYEHGLLFSYLAAPFVALATPATLITLARFAGMLIGTVEIPLLYAVGRRWAGPWVGLAAALLLALSPEGLVWGGRARMYALAQLLVLLTAFLAYEGYKPGGKAALRWAALVALAGGLLAQFGVLMFVGPILAAIGLLQWPQIWPALKSPRRILPALKSHLGQIIGLALIIAGAMLIKRLGQPLGMAQLGAEPAANPVVELWNTLAYQIGVVFDWDSTISFLTRQFGVPHHLWLTVAAVVGILVLVSGQRSAVGGRSSLVTRHSSLAFVSLVFGLTILEMITLLEPFRRNPRYVMMALPLFYLMAAQSGKLILDFGFWIYDFRWMKWLATGLLAGMVVLHGRGLWQDGLIAYRTPEPPYQRAFAYVADHLQADDVVLTVNPSAAALYLPRVDYFAQQADAEQFLLNTATQPVDRWVGLPWLGTTTDFNRVLNAHQRAWFVADEQRLTNFGFFKGDWLALLNTQMEPVWAEQGAIVYRTRADRVVVPDTPTVGLNAEFGGQIKLNGYTLDSNRLTLFWQAITQPQTDYSVFIHLRNAQNATVAQWDRQPLEGAYPTRLWQPAETLADPLTLSLPADLPPGDYRLAIGLYRLDTLERLPLYGTGVYGTGETVPYASAENAVLIPFTAAP